VADGKAKWLAELVKPLCVTPGSKVRLPHDYDPGFKAGWLKKKEGEEYLHLTVELLAEYQQRLAAQDTYGVLVVLQAMDAASKDGHSSRHERSEPPGRRRSQLQDPVGRGARPRFPLALRSAPARAWADRHLQPLPLRGGPRRTGPPTAAGVPKASAGGERRGSLGTPLPRDQQLGALPRRQRLSTRQAVPQHQPRGAAKALSEAHRPPREELEVLSQRRERAVTLGPASTPTRRCSRTPAPNRLPGT